MPNADRAIFRARDDDGQLGVVAGKGNIIGVPVKGGDERLGGVVPDLDGAVVGGGQDIRLVGVGVVIDMVDTLGLMRFKGEVGSSRTKAPDLDGAVETCRGEGIRILGVDGKTHDIMAVALEDLHAFPALLPIPKLNCHIIGCGEDEWL